jgi:hypothetical protein
MALRRDEANVSATDPLKELEEKQAFIEKWVLASGNVPREKAVEQAELLLETFPRISHRHPTPPELMRFGKGLKTRSS